MSPKNRGVRINISAPGPRPSFYKVAEHIWGKACDIDSDGNSQTPQDRQWTELTIELRGIAEQRVDIYPVSTEPLILQVCSSSAPLAQKVAQFVVACSGGEYSVLPNHSFNRDAQSRAGNPKVICKYNRMKRWPFTGLLLIIIPLSLFIGKDSLMRNSFDAKYFSSSSKIMKFRMALDLVNTKRLIGDPVDMAKANLGRPDYSSPDSISYAINEPLGYRDTLTLRIKNGLVSDIYIHD